MENRERRLRWWGAAAGIAVAVADTWIISAFGVTFEMNGADVGWMVVGWFGTSFATLGFLVGLLVELRRRDRRTAAVIRSQMETIRQARSRLAQAEKLASLGQLATAIAHEVRNPLAVIRSAAQGLAENEAGEEARQACAFITAEIDRLTSVIGSLLDFARPPRLEPRRIPVAALFERIELLTREELLERGIRLRLPEPSSLPEVTADFDLLSQVILDLLANAREAVPAGGEIGLSAARRADAVEIDVTDSGPGIAPELRERIFDPFFTTRARGVGLGLAVARQILGAHGGSIDAGEHPGGGARFRLRLPLAAGEALAA